MKRRKLKSPQTVSSNVVSIADRKATAPRGAIIAVDEVSDPYDPPNRISVVRNVSGDPLAALRARHQIDDAQYSAGRQWQRYYETSQLGDLRGQDMTRPFVDGGAGGHVLTDARIRAIAHLGTCRYALGSADDQLVRDVLGHGMTIAEVAIKRDLSTRRQVEFLGARLRDALETLAKLFGFA